MSVKPILFNTDMVQAILDGRKTVTRRVIKQPYYVQGDEKDKRTLLAVRTDPKGSKLERLIGSMPYPDDPYKIGDTLYVRERFCKGRIDYGEESDGRAVPYVSQCDRENDFIPYEYCLREGIGIEDVVWHPSIHMPREAARIWLKVTDVRVERLQDITSDQIYREGVETEYPFVLNGEERRYAFSQLWSSTLKKSDLDRYGWDANPWVWVIEFEQCGKPESEG